MPSEADGRGAYTRSGDELTVQAEPVFEGCHLMKLRGQLDLETAPLLKDVIAELDRENARTLILSLEECTFVDSTGLQAVLKSAKDLDSGGVKLLLAGARGPVLRLLETTGVTNMALVYESVDQAKRAALG
jgi:stage II sporulation protein AA (anti-sigma F factor antagonist)